MPSFICERCGRTFLADQSNEFQVRSGRRLSEPQDEESLRCPHCGHVQERGEFATPL